jgi:hypothetical protein
MPVAMIFLLNFTPQSYNIYFISQNIFLNKKRAAFSKTAPFHYNTIKSGTDKKRLCKK